MSFGEMWFPAKEDSTIVGRIGEANAPDMEKSKAAGKTVWKRVPVLLSKVPGSHDVSSQAIKPHNKDELCARFPGAWEYYEKEKGATIDDAVFAAFTKHGITFTGTPIDRADFLPRDKIAWLITLGFTSIEQLADMNDMTAQNLKGAVKWRNQAKEFLKRT